MSVKCVAYQRQCDRCGALHEKQLPKARQTIAAARRSGWVRHQRTWGAWWDYCPACWSKFEAETEPTP